MKNQTILNQLSLSNFDVLSTEEARQILGGRHGCRRKVRMPKCKKRRYGCHSRSTKSSTSSSSCGTPPPPPPIVP